MKPGFKQTEVGSIPVDWDVGFIGDLAQVTTGSKNTQDAVADGQYPFFVRSQTIERINTFSFDGEAVLTAGDGVGTGKVFHYIDGKFDVHQRVYRISNFDRRLNGYYFFRYFSLHFYHRIMQMTAKSSVDSIRRPMITKMLVPLPPTVEEQEAIAEALGNADAMMESLERLIAKKRDVKQGAMQELLTGKRRLPGFTDPWKSKKLSDLLRYERPDKYIVHSDVYTEHGNIPVLTANKSFVLGFTDEDYGVFQSPPVIIFDDFTTDSKYVDFSFKVKSSAIKLLHAKCDEACLRFVSELMHLVKYPIGEHKRYYISEYQYLEMPMPGLSEQTAIAGILSDMDAELAALEAKLSKARAIKQGMMQELLTGRIRLK